MRLTVLAITLALLAGVACTGPVSTPSPMDQGQQLEQRIATLEALHATSTLPLTHTPTASATATAMPPLPTPTATLPPKYARVTGSVVVEPPNGHQFQICWDDSCTSLVEVLDFGDVQIPYPDRSSRGQMQSGVKRVEPIYFHNNSSVRLLFVLGGDASMWISPIRGTYNNPNVLVRATLHGTGNVLEPGETREGHFVVQVTEEAEPKLYEFELEISARARSSLLAHAKVKGVVMTNSPDGQRLQVCWNLDCTHLVTEVDFGEVEIPSFEQPPTDYVVTNGERIEPVYFRNDGDASLELRFADDASMWISPVRRTNNQPVVLVRATLHGSGNVLTPGEVRQGDLTVQVTKEADPQIYEFQLVPDATLSTER